MSGLAGVAALALVLSACGGGGDDAAPSSSGAEDAPSAAAGKALTQADLPAGLTVSSVDANTAFLNAAQTVQDLEGVEITPAPCKAKSVAAQEEVRDTIKSGSQQTIAQGERAAYGVTLLSNAKLGVFEAAGTGECADVSFGAQGKQTTTRKDLPAGVDAKGFVLEIARVAPDRTTNGASAYFAKNGVTALVTANAGADGKINQAEFDDVMRRVAAKL